MFGLSGDKLKKKLAGRRRVLFLISKFDWSKLEWSLVVSCYASHFPIANAFYSPPPGISEPDVSSICWRKAENKAPMSTTIFFPLIKVERQENKSWNCKCRFLGITSWNSTGFQLVRRNIPMLMHPKWWMTTVRRVTFPSVAVLFGFIVRLVASIWINAIFIKFNWEDDAPKGKRNRVGDSRSTSWEFSCCWQDTFEKVCFCVKSLENLKKFLNDSPTSFDTFNKSIDSRKFHIAR